MTFTARRYDEIVRDMLTTLTGGTVREWLVVPPDTPLMPKLRRHPVRRISHAEGKISVTVTVPDPSNPSKKKKEEQLRDYRFTAADLELVSTNANPNDLDAIRFRDKGRKPVPGSTLIINYYPVQTDPVPLTDLQVGSVVRTVLETIGVELALTYQQLEQVYKSAFVETAEGDSLDKVVTLVGVQRLPNGRPTAKLRFSRRSGTAGAVTIPTSTPVTDDKGNRYLTVAEATMEPEESTREITATAESGSTPEVGKNALRFLEAAVAGISEVTNPEPSKRLTEPETDDALRTRARGALRSTMRGTVDAIRFGLLAVHGVKDVSITEFPNKRPGEIKVDIAYSDPSDAVKAVALERLRQLRPAGIVVIPGEAAKLTATVRIELTLAGSSLSSADLQSLKDGVTERVDQALKQVAPGGTVRGAQLVSAALSDTRIVDATVALTANGAPFKAQLPEGTVLDAPQPFEIATKFEETGAATVTSRVTATLPLHLVPGTTKEQAQAMIENKVAAHLASRKSEKPLSFDSLADALIDDAHYALVRADGLLTVESQGLFKQLTDAAGSYAPVAKEVLVAGTVTLDVRGLI